MKPRVLIARPFTGRLANYAHDYFDAHIADTTWDAEQAIQKAQKWQPAGLVFGAHLKLDAAAINCLPDSIKIAATTSVGHDHMDLAALRKRNIVATYTPNAVTVCTADHSIMLMLCACRRAHEYDEIMRTGWNRRFAFDELLGVRFSGRRLGIFGMGRVGQAVAKRARAFGLKIHYFDVRQVLSEDQQGSVYYPTLEAMLPHCDILSLHVPASVDLGQIINRETLALLPPGAIVINAARGSLIDEDALIDALQSGKLRAAGLDTFQSEPSPDSRLTRLPNVFLTPHMGAATEEARFELGICALDNVRAVLSGEKALDPIEGEQYV